jgi:hypothetical protein
MRSTEWLPASRLLLTPLRSVLAGVAPRAAIGDRGRSAEEEMNTFLRILTLLAALWALLPPASYGLMFSLFLDWSVFLDFLVSGSCIVLAISAFRRMRIEVWTPSFAVPTLFMTAGLIHNFRTGGESGPLPFEWITGYARHAIPLLLISIVVRLHQNRQAEQDGGGNSATLRASP